MIKEYLLITLTSPILFKKYSEHYAVQGGKCRRMSKNIDIDFLNQSKDLFLNFDAFLSLSLCGDIWKQII